MSPRKTTSTKEVKSVKNPHHKEQKQLKTFVTRLVQSRNYREYAKLIFSSLLMFKPSSEQPEIVQTDGVTISVNEGFLSAAEAVQTWLFFMELFHNALSHPQKVAENRKAGFDPKLLNVCQNIVLTELLNSNTAISSSIYGDVLVSEYKIWDYSFLYSQGILAEEDISKSDLTIYSAKQLYNVLRQKGDQEKLSQAFQSNAPLLDLRPDLSSESQQALDKGTVFYSSESVKAASFEQMLKDIAQKAGDGSAFQELLMRMFPPPKVDWKRYLRVTMSETLSDDQEYSEIRYDPDAAYLSDRPFEIMPLVPDIETPPKLSA